MNKISRYIPNRYIFLLITLLIFFHVINNYNVLTASSLRGCCDAKSYFKRTGRILNDIKKVKHPWELPGMLIKQFFSQRYQGNRSPLFLFLA